MDQEADAAGAAVGYILGFIFIGGALAMVIASFYVSPDELTDSGHSLRTFLRVFGGSILGMAAFGLPLGIYLHVEKQKKVRQHLALKASAVPGELRILSFEQVRAYEEFVDVSLEVEVTVPPRPPYKLRLVQSVPNAYVGRLRPDERLPVKVPPAQPEMLFIEWGGRAGPEGAPPG